MNVLVCTTNKKYLPLTETFLNSLLINSPNTFDKIVVRCVGFDHDFRYLSEKIHSIHDNKPLSTVRNMLSQDGECINDYLSEGFKKSKIGFRGSRWLHSEEIAYCSNSKVVTIDDHLGDDTQTILYSDVDTIIRGNIDTIVEAIRVGDICVVVDTPYGEQHLGSKRLQGHEKLYQGGMIGFNNNERVRDFVKEWRCSVMSNYQDWDADEKCFYECLQSRSLRINSLDIKFKDENMDIDSLVWSGAGTTKYHEDIYVNEYNRYKLS